ncbi:MAG: CPBP family intramembrane glutamic endopeptidase [Gemmatimonadota bacterium]
MKMSKPAPAAQVRRTRKAAVFTVVLIFGFAGFAAPAVFFQMGNAGGYRGANLAILGVVQLVVVGAIVSGGLRLLRMEPVGIGLTARGWRRDALVGLIVAGVWALIQFGWLIPGTGGAERGDIGAILDMTGGQWTNVIWYLPLGILGGGIAEEIYGRGFVITVLSDVLGNSTAGIAVAAMFSILFFAAGHLPAGWVEWMDILIPSTAYVGLFLHTRRLTAPIVAHAAWNTMAVVGIQAMYG